MQGRPNCARVEGLVSPGPPLRRGVDDETGTQRLLRHYRALFGARRACPMGAIEPLNRPSSALEGVLSSPPHRNNPLPCATCTQPEQRPPAGGWCPAPVPSGFKTKKTIKTKINTKTKWKTKTETRRRSSRSPGVRPTRTRRSPPARGTERRLFPPHVRPST